MLLSLLEAKNWRGVDQGKGEFTEGSRDMLDTAPTVLAVLAKN